MVQEQTSPRDVAAPEPITPRFTRRAGLAEDRTLEGRLEPARSGASSRSTGASANRCSGRAN